MTSSKGCPVGRRQFSIGLGAAALSAPFIARRSLAQDAGRLILPTYGGSYQEHLEKAFANPFTEETGIEVVFSGVPDLARLKAQVESGRPEWDIFEAGSSWGPTGSQEGLFQPLDTSIIDPKFVRGEGDYALFYQYLTCITWNGDYHGDDTVPRDWQQFWDYETIPGRRSLRNRADMTLELALVADGVAPDQLYPLDVDRAFASLERIKPAIAKWATTTSELTKMVSSNEIDFVMNYTGRVKGARESGIPLRMSLDQVMFSNDYIAVVKGTPHVEAAMKFVEFVLRPDRQIAFATLDIDMPADPSLVASMSDEAKKWLPQDPTSPRHIHQDDEWWVGRTGELQQRFLSFLLN